LGGSKTSATILSSDERREALRHQFRDLLLLACRHGLAPYVQQQLEQLGRRTAIEAEGLAPLLERVRQAADDVAEIMDHTTEDAAQRLQAERRLRHSVHALSTELSTAYAQTNATLITTLGVIDQTLGARVDQLAALQAVNSAANSSLDLSTVLELTVKAVRGVTRSDLCSIYLFDDQRNDLVLQASTGLSPDVIGRARMLMGEGITGWAAQIGKPVAVPDAWADPHFKYIPESGEESYRSMLSVPIILFTVHKLVGVLNVQTIQVREWTADEIAFVETVGGQIALAIENARLYHQTDDQLRRKVEQLTTLQRVSALVASSLDVSEVMESIVTYLRELGRADMCAIFTYDTAREEFHIVASQGLSQQYRERVRVPMGDGVVSLAVKSGEPVIVTDAWVDTRIAASQEDIRREGYRSLLAIPLITKRGALGAACLYTMAPGRFVTEDIQILFAFTNEAALALENANLYEEVRQGLQTKSTLLAEMHHRVKNNLQTIAALLSLQQRRARGPDERSALAESVSRIQSIAAIHDLLSHKDIGIASVRDIVQQVVSSVTSALSATAVHVHYETDDGNPQIASKEATVLALVVNELVTNSIQHGFEGRERGTIRVGVYVEGEQVTVEVRDDGQGLPAGFTFDQNGGLGVQIVRTLVGKDLRGSFDLRDDNGAVATVRFPAGSLLSAAAL
jgi:two-component sensor histidine kinase